MKLLSKIGVFNKSVSFLTKERIMTLSMLIAAAITVLIGSFSAFAAECDELPDKLFRMHILANSDSEEDQALKYALRDFLSKDMQYIFEGCSTAEEAKDAARSNLKKIAMKARQFVREQGYDYQITASVERVYFTTRQYGALTVPAGEYDALRILIGEGEGKNWWCVMFPPLCLSAVEDYVYNGADTIDPSKPPQVKFALYEWLKKLFR